MQSLKKLEDAVASWPQISVHAHRFGGREFRFANVEVRNVHNGGIVDIPFQEFGFLERAYSATHRLASPC